MDALTVTPGQQDSLRPRTGFADEFAHHPEDVTVVLDLREDAA